MDGGDFGNEIVEFVDFSCGIAFAVFSMEAVVGTLGDGVDFGMDFALDFTPVVLKLSGLSIVAARMDTVAFDCVTLGKIFGASMYSITEASSAPKLKEIMTAAKLKHADRTNNEYKNLVRSPCRVPLHEAASPTAIVFSSTVQHPTK